MCRNVQVVRLIFVNKFVKFIKITNCVCGRICNGRDVHTQRTPGFLVGSLPFPPQICTIYFCSSLNIMFLFLIKGQDPENVQFALFRYVLITRSVVMFL